VRPQRGPTLLRVRAIPAVGLSSAAPSIEANRGDGDTERQRVTEDRFEMSEELEEPMRIVQLGVIAAPFTRFARELMRWVQEADLQD
jgi:hypothetical protein